jgi:ATP-binding cassette subfamily B protein
MRPIFIRQRDITDCGVACLLSVIRMHDGDTTLEHLRVQSGTSIQGATLLGLKQAAESVNIEADVFEVDDLQVFRTNATFPCILHVISESNQEHYVVCFDHSFSHDSKSVSYTIIDPARGIKQWTEVELKKNWSSRMVLCLSPTEKFEKRKFNNTQQWSWFSQLIKEDIPLLLIAMGLGILLSIFGLVTAVFNQKLIDEILPEKDFKRLWAGMSFLLIILIIRACLNYLRTLLLLRYAKSFNVRLFYSFYRKLFHLPKLFFDTRKMGEIIARLNDTRRIQGLISYLTAQVAIDILVVCISVASIMYYSWEIGIVALTVIPIFGFIVFKYRRKISDSQRDVMSGYATSESHFIDIVGLIEPIKLGNKEGFFSQIGKSIYGSFQERLYQLGMLTNKYHWWNEFTNAIYTAVILLLMSLMLLNSQLKLGEFMAILTLLVTVLAAMGRIAMTNFQMQEAIVAFNRMYEFAQTQPEKVNSIDEGSLFDEIKSIQISDLSFRFPGSAVLLQSVNLNLVRGRWTVLLGEVGSGKSVLLQLLQKFRSYESGQVLVNSTRLLPDIEVTSWRKKIGVVPQSIGLFSGTIIENIVLDNITNEEQSRFSAFCNKFGFDIFLKRFPQSYLTLVGENGCNLSGGQCQMVALMRSLYNDPDVLLLDEPTSAMDSKTELFVLSLLKKLKSEKIIFMVTHGKNYAEFADIVVHLENGKTF